MKKSSGWVFLFFLIISIGCYADSTAISDQAGGFLGTANQPLVAHEALGAPQMTYPSVQVMAPASVNNALYRNYPMCPAIPACPDINNRLPTGTTTANCPDTCLVTRQVTTRNVPAVGQVVASTVEPTCPAGYTVVNVFNMGVGYNTDPTHFYSQPTNYNKEIVNSPTPIALPYPITSLTTLQQYMADTANYTCGTEWNNTQTETICADSRNTTRDALVGARPSGQIMMIEGVVGVYSTPADITNYSVTYYQGGGGCTNPTATGGLIASTINYKYQFQYDRYRCQANGNSLVSTNVPAPLSAMCARIKPSWASPN